MDTFEELGRAIDKVVNFISGLFSWGNLQN